MRKPQTALIMSLKYLSHQIHCRMIMKVCTKITYAQTLGFLRWFGWCWQRLSQEVFLVHRVLILIGGDLEHPRVEGLKRWNRLSNYP